MSQTRDVHYPTLPTTIHRSFRRGDKDGKEEGGKVEMPEDVRPELGVVSMCCEEGGWGPHNACVVD